MPSDGEDGRRWQVRETFMSDMVRMLASADVLWIGGTPGITASMPHLGSTRQDDDLLLPRDGYRFLTGA